MENPPKKYFRLSPGNEIRLKYAYYVTCTDFFKDDSGNIIEVHCTYDPDTKGGWSYDGRKVHGTLHWVSAHHNIDAEVRLYDHLFHIENPEDSGDDFIQNLNPKSLTILNNCKLEPSLKNAELGIGYQFLRIGYFGVDIDSTPNSVIFNRTAGRRGNWAKKN